MDAVITLNFSLFLVLRDIILLTSFVLHNLCMQRTCHFSHLC